MKRPKPQTITSQTFFSELSSKLRQSAIRPNINGYRPHEKQEQFHRSDKKGKLFIGGNRSGKTVGGATEAVWRLTGRHPYRRDLPPPPIRARCVSVDFPQGVEKIVGPEVARWLPPSELIGGSWEDSWDKETRTLTLQNGSFLEFMSYDQKLDKFAGTSRHFTWFDEEPPNAIFTECMLRLVDVNGDWWITMTPVEGMTWIYDMIYLKGKSGDPNLLVIEVEMLENPHINEGEAEIILAGLTADERKARERGQFVQIGGLIYKEWNPDLHIITGDFAVPDEWLKFCALDHGFNNATSWGWYGVSPDGTIVRFDEHYEAGKLIGHHAEKVHERNQHYGITPSYYVGDRTIANTDPITGTSIQIEYVERGIPISLAGGSNDVKSGIQRVARYLTPVGGRPKFYLTENCQMAAWEFARYRWATWKTKKAQFENDRKEEPHKKDDHAMDEIRYAITSRPEADSGIEIPEFSIPGGVSVGVPVYGRVDEALTKPRRQEHADFNLGSEW